MKKLVIVFGVAIAFASCSIFEEPRYKVDPILQKFTSEFYADGLKRGYVNLNKPSIELADNAIRGLYFAKDNVVQIKRNFVIDQLSKRTAADSNFVKLVLYHELGHSIGKDHRGPQMSIMNTGNLFDGNGDFIMTLRFYNESLVNANQLIDELFN